MATKVSLPVALVITVLAGIGSIALGVKLLVATKPALAAQRFTGVIPDPGNLCLLDKLSTNPDPELQHDEESGCIGRQPNEPCGCRAYYLTRFDHDDRDRVEKALHRGANVELWAKGEYGHSADEVTKIVVDGKPVAELGSERQWAPYGFMAFGVLALLGAANTLRWLKKQRA